MGFSTLGMAEQAACRSPLAWLVFGGRGAERISSLPAFWETGLDEDLRLQDLMAGLAVHFLAVTLGKLGNFFNHGSNGSGAAFSHLERDRVFRSTYCCEPEWSQTVSLL